MLKIDLVVAKYKEDVSWVEEVKSKYNVIVYSKDENETNSDFEILPNVGRESQTYVHHIIKNFENLADCTIFTQGYPFDHKGDFVRHISEIDYLNIDKFLPIGVGTYTCDDNGNPHHPGLQCGLYTEELLGEYRNYFEFYPGALFVLTKSAILEKGIKYFQRLNDIHYECNDFPWMVERLWGHIFNYDYNKNLT